MADGHPRLLVGRLMKDGEMVTLIAEKAFKCQEQQVMKLLEEQQAIRLQDAETEICVLTGKRTADELVLPTPLKMKSGRWGDDRAP